MYILSSHFKFAKTRQAFVSFVVLLLATTSIRAQEKIPNASATDNLASVAKLDQVDSVAKVDLAIALESIEGNSIQLFNTNNVGTVVLFISTDCPIGNSYQPLLEQLRSQWSQHKLQLVMIHGNPEVTKDQALQHAKEYNVRWPVVLDPQQKIAKLLQAKNIPESFVLDKEGNVVYRGRIDDQYSTLGKKRPAPTTNDLRDAVNCLLNSKPIAIRETKAVGCVIRYANR